MTAMLIAQVWSFSAQLERLGRAQSIDEEQMTAIYQDLAENMTVVAIGRKYGIPRTTLRDNLERTNAAVLMPC